MSDALLMSVLERLYGAAREKTAANPALTRALLLGGGALGAAVPTALVMHKHEQMARERASNVGFGAGLATGMAGPDIVRGLYSMSQNGMNPQGGGQ